MLTPELMAAIGGGDGRGESGLHRVSPFTWVGVAIGAGVKGRMVPSEFWSRDVADDGTGIVVIACPCGHEPHVPTLALRACECQRTYFNGEAEVWSLAVPSPSPPESDQGVH